MKGETVGEVDLPDAFFARPWNSDLVYQALQAQVANRRQPLAHAKTRSEVSGGGKKPWKQKGTGRARHGSIRSPLWRHGGVTHGPLTEKIYAKKINRKMKQAALASALSKKLAEGELKVVDSFGLKEPKTNILARSLKTFFKQPKKAQKLSALLVADEKAVFRACSNIPGVKGMRFRELNVEDVLKHKNVLVEKAALGEAKT